MLNNNTNTIKAPGVLRHTERFFAGDKSPKQANNENIFKEILERDFSTANNGDIKDLAVQEEIITAKLGAIKTMSDGIENGNIGKAIAARKDLEKLIQQGSFADLVNQENISAQNLKLAS